MMTKEEELKRYHEDRDMLEGQIESDSEAMKQIEMFVRDFEEDPDWNNLWDQINAAENEVADLTRNIDELEEELGVSHE